MATRATKVKATTASKKAKASNDEYSANDLKALDQHQALLQNLSVTFGETEDETEPYSRQKGVAIREILDNGLDEIRSGHGNKLRLCFYRDGAVLVQDSGRGIPVDVGHDATGKPVSGVYLAMGVMNAGRNYTNDSKRFSSGRHGLGGASTVHASYRADVIVYRANENGEPCKYSLSFKDGTPGFFDDDADMDPAYRGAKYAKLPEAAKKPFTPLTDLTELRVEPDTRSKAERDGYETGTVIKFWPSALTFRSEKPFDDQDLVSRLRDTAFLVPSLEAEVYDELHLIPDPDTGVEEPQHEFFHFEAGMDDFIELVQPDEPICKSIHIQTTGHYVEKMAIDRTSNSSVEYHDQEREIPIDVIMRWGNGYAPGDNVRSYVNTIRTKLGGEHLIGFTQGVVNAFNAKFQSMRGVIKKGDELPNKDDYLEGLTAIVSVLVSAPSFTSQTKEALSGSQIRGAVRKAVETWLTDWCEQPKNKETLSLIATKVTTAAKNRKVVADEKAAKRKANAMRSATMPAKLSECEFVGEPGSEFLICEGNSAKSGLMKARDARFQALFPIRGKFINCLKAETNKVLANKEASDIIKALGCGSTFTKDFNIDNLRYDRVLIATDADIDGLDIQDLLLVFFWRAMPDLIKQGKFFITVPPLFEISFKERGKGKGRATEYAENEDKLKPIIERLQKQGYKQGTDYEIHRDKGLGENDGDVTWETMMNPRNRTLRRIVIDDVKQAEAAIDLAMGPNVDNRRQWIEDNYDRLNPDLLDI